MNKKLRLLIIITPALLIFATSVFANTSEEETSTVPCNNTCTSKNTNTNNNNNENHNDIDIDIKNNQTQNQTVNIGGAAPRPLANVPQQLPDTGASAPYWALMATATTAGLYLRKYKSN